MNKVEAHALAGLVAKVNVIEKVLIAMNAEDVQQGLINTFAEIQAKIDALYIDEPASNIILPGVN